MDRFGPTGKVSKKLVHLLRWTTFPAVEILVEWIASLAPLTNGGIWGAIHSTKISGNFGSKLNGSVRSNRKKNGSTF